MVTVGGVHKKCGALKEACAPPGIFCNSRLGKHSSMRLPNLAAPACGRETHYSAPRIPTRLHVLLGGGKSACTHQRSSYWTSSKFFPGSFNPQARSDYAIKQTELNRQSAIAASKSSHSAYNMFNACYLLKNGKPHSMYTAPYDSSIDETQYVTYAGGFPGSEYYGHAQLWTFSLRVRH